MTRSFQTADSAVKVTHQADDQKYLKSNQSIHINMQHILYQKWFKKLPYFGM